MTSIALEGYEGYETLAFERSRNGVLVIRMNRPEVLNAMTFRMHTELARVWQDVAADARTNVAVVTGAGRGFSSGNDQKQPAADYAQRLRTMNESREIVYGMLGLDKPIVAAINGVAVGAGLAVGLLADVSVVADDARLIDGHTRLGVAAGDHACLLWPLMCGMAKAKWYLYSNEPLLGKEAERIGLVTESVPTEQVLPRALQMAEQLSRGSQQAIGWTKRSINGWYKMAYPVFEQSLAAEFLGIMAGEDVHEARKSFREKRPPVFPSSAEAFDQD
jgi:enoyl-CoA hydratase